MGFNAEGFIKPNSKDAYILELEKRLKALEEMKLKKSKKKLDFSNLLPNVHNGEKPWDW
jgi:hypothetical protein